MGELKKEPFKFEYATPSLDWYRIIKVEIKPDDYYYFKLVRRYGLTWWLVGKNPPAKNSQDYKWTEKEIGEISNCDIARFIEWAKFDYGGSRIVEVSAISGSFDILKEIEKLLSDMRMEADNG